MQNAEVMKDASAEHLDALACDMLDVKKCGGDVRAHEVGSGSLAHTMFICESCGNDWTMGQIDSGGEYFGGDYAKLVHYPGRGFSPATNAAQTIELLEHLQITHWRIAFAKPGWTVRAHGQLGIGSGEIDIPLELTRIAFAAYFTRLENNK